MSYDNSIVLLFLLSYVLYTYDIELEKGIMHFLHIEEFHKVAFHKF